jgi:hypothetical protein
VIFEKEWGDHPYSLKILRDCDISYCYYDYFEACSKFFLYETPKFDHSWFVNFDQNNFEGILLLWFSRWWRDFGLIPEIFPLKLIESFNIFKDNFKTDAYDSKFPFILHFVKKFKISWILKWQYVIVKDKLVRHWYDIGMLNGGINSPLIPLSKMLKNWLMLPKPRIYLPMLALCF